MYPILRYFSYLHLPPNLQQVSKPFADLAAQLAEELPNNEETSTALRKLLEAKDCAVRSSLSQPRERLPTPDSNPSNQ